MMIHLPLQALDLYSEVVSLRALRLENRSSAEFERRYAELMNSVPEACKRDVNWYIRVGNLSPQTRSPEESDNFTTTPPKRTGKGGEYTRRNARNRRLRGAKATGLETLAKLLTNNRKGGIPDNDPSADNIAKVYEDSNTEDL